jgi:predicted DCC family thiol-disulfide oxidoreductase YuxK
MVEAENLIILFDGDCNLCNSTVQFVIDRDKKDLFRFCALQSDTGKLILKKNKLPDNYTDSFLLYYNNKLYTKSSAALYMVKKMQMPWKMLFVFIIIPKLVRDAVYSFIAKNRYKWFGKSEYCRVMTPELKHKFLP